LAAVRLLLGNQNTPHHQRRFALHRVAHIGSAQRFAAAIACVLSLYSIFKVRIVG
jgi:hypothetical protein